MFNVANASETKSSETFCLAIVSSYTMRRKKNHYNIPKMYSKHETTDVNGYLLANTRKFNGSQNVTLEKGAALVSTQSN